MKIGDIIKEGTILVAREDKMLACGVIIVRKGSIIKCAKETKEYSGRVRVYRNRREENSGNWKGIDLADVREAKTHEIEMWNKDIYYVESVNTVNNDNNN
jgi:hypothetical protein